MNEKNEHASAEENLQVSNAGFEEYRSELHEFVKQSKDENVAEPIPVPKVLGVLTDPTITVFVDFVKGFYGDYTGNEFLITKLFRTFIRMAITLFLLISLVSVTLFLVAQIKQQWSIIHETDTECKLQDVALDSTKINDQSNQCKYESEFETHDQAIPVDTTKEIDSEKNQPSGSTYENSSEPTERNVEVDD